MSCAAGTMTLSRGLGANRLPSAVDDDINARRIPRWRGFNLQGRFAPPGDAQSADPHRLIVADPTRFLPKRQVVFHSVKTRQFPTRAVSATTSSSR